MAGESDVQYLVLPNSARPYLLARVRWPDVAQAISVAQPEWQDDPGLFDLPYDPSGEVVTLAQAESIALAWGSRLPAAGTVPPLGPVFVRRMPADWSNLTPAEKRAWSLELVAKHRPAQARPRRRAARGSHARPGTPVARWRGVVRTLRHPLLGTWRGAMAAVAAGKTTPALKADVRLSDEHGAAPARPVPAPVIALDDSATIWLRDGVDDGRRDLALVNGDDTSSGPSGRPDARP